MKIYQKLNKKSGGYVLLGIVSVVSFAMLLIVVSIGQQSIIGRSNVDRYQDWRTAQTNIFSCISILREKIINNNLSEIVSVDNERTLSWRLRNGVCEIEILNQNSNFFEFQVQSIVGDRYLTKAFVKIEKDTAKVLSIN